MILNRIVYLDISDEGKYGRPVVKIFMDPNRTQCVNQVLIDNHYARPYDGGTRQEFSPEYYQDILQTL